MAMIECPECKKKISENADSCPKCGYHLNQERIAEIKKEMKRKEQGLVKGFAIGLAGVSAIFLTLIIIGSQIDTTPRDFGTRYEIGVAGQKFPADLYYTAGVSEGIMYELAAYLVVTDFYKDSYWSVQVNKNGEVYEFKWAARVNDKLDPTAHREAVKEFSAQLSKRVFKGASRPSRLIIGS